MEEEDSLLGEGFRGEWDRALNEVKSRALKVVGLQLPEGLIRKSPDLMDDISERTGAEPVLLADPCYGACGAGGIRCSLGSGGIFSVSLQPAPMNRETHTRAK